MGEVAIYREKAIMCNNYIISVYIIIVLLYLMRKLTFFEEGNQLRTASGYQAGYM